MASTDKIYGMMNIKVHKDIHKKIKIRASLHSMTIIDYLDYVVNEEIKAFEEFKKEFIKD